MKKRKCKKQPSCIELLTNKLVKGSLLQGDFLDLLSDCESNFFENPSLQLELLISNGLPLSIENNYVVLKTANTKIKDQIFCVVDIETTGGDANHSQIIELGAVKLLNGKIIDSYESLVYCKDIPQYVQDITSITPQMLKNAPKLRDVLEEFKLFLEDDLFVAHNIKFDYKFISDSFKKYDLGELQNRKLCTIDLAKRTFLAQRYGLDYLKEFLELEQGVQHRALNDALNTAYVLKYCLEKLSKKIFTAEDLITFSNSNCILKS